MVDAIQSGIISSAVRERIKELEIEREQISMTLDKALIERPVFTKEQIIAWITKFKFGDIDNKAYQKKVIDTFLNSIYVYEDKLVLTYNYKDGSETLMFSEIGNTLRSNEKIDVLPSSESAPLLWGAFVFIIIDKRLPMLYNFCSEMR